MNNIVPLSGILINVPFQLKSQSCVTYNYKNSLTFNQISFFFFETKLMKLFKNVNWVVLNRPFENYCTLETSILFKILACFSQNQTAIMQHFKKSVLLFQTFTKRNLRQKFLIHKKKFNSRKNICVQRNEEQKFLT